MRKIFQRTLKTPVKWILGVCSLGVAIALGTLTVDAVEWLTLTNDEQGNVYFMDLHSITPMGGKVWSYAWTTTPKMAKDIAKGTGCPVAKQVRRVVVFNASDCGNQKIYKAIQTRFYDKKGQIIWKELKELVERPAQTPKPKSVFERMHQTVCQIEAYRDVDSTMRSQALK
jgi:hypothetical protein